MSENTPYVSLANKYRPQRFEDMVGQESISKTLQNALKLGRIAHAYLFYGPRGCGKTTTARILAKALNCTGHGQDKPTPQPCGECPQCQDIAQSADMDVLELDAASNTQVEKVREAIIDTVALASSRNRYKVFILDEVHMLSTSSFNALLKTIEEPPQHVVFILATTEKHKVPATIVSRCQTFRFRPMTSDEITNHLLDLAEAEGLDLTEKAARIIAKNAGGAMRDALTLMDRAIAYSDGKIDEKLVGEMLGLTPQDLLAQTVRALIEKDGSALHSVFETLRAEGFDANAFLKDLKNALGELFYFSLNHGATPFDQAPAIIKQASAGLLAALSRKINKLAEEVKFSDNALVSAEVGLFTVMDSCFDVEGFIRRLEALERGENNGGGSPSQTSSSSSSKRQMPSGAKPVSQGTSHSTENHTQAAWYTQKTAESPAASGNAAALAVGPLPAYQGNAVTAAAQTRTADAAFSTISTPVATAAAQKPLSASGTTQPSAVVEDNHLLWNKVVKAFERSPFVYDAMTNCSVHFEGDLWLIHFSAGKEFYKVPAQTKLAELEKTAFKLGGRHIKIQIVASSAVQNHSPAASSAAAEGASAAAVPGQKDSRAGASAGAGRQVSQTACVSQTKKESSPAGVVISREEPFVAADFSADIEPASVTCPDEIKGILDVIEGEVLA